VSLPLDDVLKLAVDKPLQAGRKADPADLERLPELLAACRERGEDGAQRAARLVLLWSLVLKKGKAAQFDEAATEDACWALAWASIDAPRSSAGLPDAALATCLRAVPGAIRDRSAAVLGPAHIARLLPFTDPTTRARLEAIATRRNAQSFEAIVADAEATPTPLEADALLWNLGHTRRQELGASSDALLNRVRAVLPAPLPEEWQAYLGYTASVPVDEGSREPTAEDRALEEALREDPSNLDRWRVYADRLAEIGDPPEWSDLVALELEIAANGEAGPTNAQRIARDRLVFELYALGTHHYELHDELPWGLYDFGVLVPKMGFVSRAQVDRLSGPEAIWRFVQHLRVACGYDSDASLLLADIERLRPTGLRRIDFAPEWEEQSMLSWMAPLHFASFETLPRLSHLELVGSAIRLAPFESAPAVSTLRLQTLDCTDTGSVLASAALPTLADLELWVSRTPVDAFVPLLERDPSALPNLSRLALCNADDGDGLVRAVANSALVRSRSLATLDLSGSAVTASGAEVLLAHSASLAHLTLDVSGCLLNDTAVTALTARFPKLRAEEQRLMDDDDEVQPYAAVWE
jgi:hypothetical protein